MSESVVEGAKAPNFTLPDQDGKLVKLSEFQGREVVLYFYPRDDTPGCTREACGFRDSFSEIKRKGAVILGVSRDDQDSHQKFISKYNLPFTLLSDKDSQVSKMYGVYKLKNLYGKESWGIERSTFIIDEKGILKKIFRKVSVDGHTTEVLDALN
jgi:peroxiredoxin Q/BCP